jgi:hypothetical protein
MQPIDLNDIVPEGASFSLRKTGKIYRLRPINLSDEIWLQKNFGTGLDAVFREVKMKEICRIAFHQMVEEDKEEFLARDVTVINEEGEKLSVRMGGAELLFVNISGHTEKLAVFEALLHTVGVSRPMIDKLSAEEASTSKEQVSDQKKTELTGQ